MIQGERLPTLETERLRLRWLTDDDAAQIYAIFGDPEVVRYWSSPVQASIEEAAEYVRAIERHFAAKDLFQWGIARREDDLVVGTCTLAAVDASNLRADIGFALGRDHWGHGYATEAVRRVLDFAFDDLDLRRIEADVDPANDASLKLLKSFAFEREGYLRERWRVAGGVADSVLLGLLRRDWRALRAG